MMQEIVRHAENHCSGTNFKAENLSGPELFLGYACDESVRAIVAARNSKVESFLVLPPRTRTVLRHFSEQPTQTRKSYALSALVTVPLFNFHYFKI